MHHISISRLSEIILCKFLMIFLFFLTVLSSIYNTWYYRYVVDYIIHKFLNIWVSRHYGIRVPISGSRRAWRLPVAGAGQTLWLTGLPLLVILYHIWWSFITFYRTGENALIFQLENLENLVNVQRRTEISSDFLPPRH